MAETKLKSQAVEDYITSNSLHRQAIINGNFVVNQRGYVSNATLSSGTYGHDRWKAGTSGGDYTFTQLASSTQITIKSGKSLIQVVEDKNVVGGTYTLSWEGTAQARFGINSATPSGSYASSPITITTQTAGTAMSIEFNEGTLGKVQLNSDDTVLPFQPKNYAQELADCQRYYQNFTFRSRGSGTDLAYAATRGEGVIISLCKTMRTTPTLEYYYVTKDGHIHSTNDTNPADGSSLTPNSIEIYWTDGNTAYRTQNYRASGTIKVSAEL